MTTNPLTLNILPSGPDPVYRQIVDQIRRLIASNGLHLGEKLATPRDLAASLVVSPATVRRAYSELASLGFCDLDSDDGPRVAATAEHHREPDEVTPAELETARELQLRLMSPAVMVGDGFSAAARQGAVRVVGGDFYHVSEGRNGILDVIVGDVAGCGVTAGLVATSVQASAPLLGRGLSLRDAMSEMSVRLAPLLGSRRYVAMAWVRFDPSNAQIELANAGLPDPYILVPGREPEAIPTPGTRLPLGSTRRETYETTTHSFEPGARLLMLTDGLPEATAEDGEPLGYERLHELLHQQVKVETYTPDAAWLDELISGIERRNARAFNDDWTALVLRSVGVETHATVTPDSSSELPTWNATSNVER